MPSPRVIAWAPLRIATLVLGAGSSAAPGKYNMARTAATPASRTNTTSTIFTTTHLHARHDDRYDEHDLLRTMTNS